ncbi:cupin domain-containing protein [Actinomadura kijaniata]|uniref:cupin domain-containing protein n=1 Tax=Actinomadura kijaniata TaxID=46161 RepID=UPI003F1D2366
MSEDRFILLDVDASRPTASPLPPQTTLKAGAGDTEGRFTLMEEHGPRPPHVPHPFDEIVYVLGGELGVEFDGTTHRLTEGMCAFLPRGVAHALRSPSGNPARILLLSTPGGAERHGARSVVTGEPGDKSRFYVLGRGRARRGRLRVPPAFTCKARSEDTGDRLSLMEMVVAQEIPRHVHHTSDEGVYVLDGELVVEFDGTTHRAGPGRFVLLPHGVPHALRPGSTPPPRVIQISSPGGWERFVEDLIEARPHVTTAGKLDARKLNPIAARYDITYQEPS